MWSRIHSASRGTRPATPHRAGRRDERRPAGTRRWPYLGALCVACVLRAGAAGAEGAPSASQRAATQRPRVLVVGLDGADLDVLRPLMEAGAVPTLTRLADRGSLGRLISHFPTRSPAIWTTVAVGARKEKHGIYDYVTSSWYWPEGLRTKEKKLATSEMRRMPALWNRLTDAGKTSVVVGWLSTWPAERIRGEIVAAYIDLGADRQTTIKGSVYKDRAPGTTADPKTHRWLAQWLKRPTDFPIDRLKDYFDPLPPDHPLFETLPIFARYPYTVQWTAARMHNVTTSAEKLIEKHDPDLTMVYYQCPDSFGHRFWLFHEGEEAVADRLEAYGLPRAWAPELERRYGRLIEQCYRAVDAQIARLLGALGEDTNVLVVSDHGFGPCQQRCVNPKVPFNGGHRDLGIVLLSGPAFNRTPPKDPRVEDIAPTVLRILGLPVPEDLDGRPLEESLTH